MERNKKIIYYSRLVSTSYNTDSNGLKDGTKRLNYATPKKYCINISPASGSTDLVDQGLKSSYYRTMITDDMNCPSDEESFWWVDIDPNNKSHNYVVTEKAVSLNNIRYTIRRVDTDA